MKSVKDNPEQWKDRGSRDMTIGEFVKAASDIERYYNKKGFVVHDKFNDFVNEGGVK